MKVRKRFSRIVASTLTLAILLGLLPTSALAAMAGGLNAIDYKAMRLENLAAGDVAKYVYDGETNKFYATVDLSNANTWMRLSYTIEKSQPITLSLYELNEDGCSVEYPTPGSENYYAQVELAYDREDADVPEPFLGARLGTTAGVRVTDNIVEAADPNVEDLETVTWQNISHDQWMEIIGNAVELSASDYDVISNDYAFGFEGQKLIIPEEISDDVPTEKTTEELSEEPAPVPTEEPSEEPAPVPTEEPSEEPAPVLTEELAEEPAPVPTEEPSEEPAPVPAEEPSEEPAPVPTEEPILDSEQIQWVDEGDVLIERHAFSLFGIDDPSAQDGIITNYVLWNGFVSDGERTFRPSYEDGKKYVIVLEPDTPEARIYNSFLAFEQDSNSFTDFFCSIEYQEIYEYFLEKNIELSRTPDPVDLLTGSFSWNYQDLALYGKDDLVFARYYESTSKENDYGLGAGWSSNYTIKLEAENLFVHAIMPAGVELYFDLKFDGTFAETGDYTLEWDDSNYVMTYQPDQTRYVFSEDGRLMEILYLNGNTIEMTYSGDQLTEVSNATGSFTFSYEGDHLSKVTDSVGRSISF